VIVISAPELIEKTTALFSAADCPQPVAQRVAESLIGNNLAGHDSHGVMMAPHYVRRVLDGGVNPRGEVRIVRESASTALLDCGFQFGQVAALEGLELALSKAAAHDVGIVSLRNCAHVGRLGEYVTLAAERGYVGLMICNGPSPRGAVAPYGGRGRVLGTNPIAWGIPTGAQPIVVDFATSGCAWGKIGVAMAKGVPVPEGLLLDKHGQPSCDPNVMVDGGALLPFGAHKGYGLGVVVEMLGGGLSGVGPVFWREDGHNQGTFLMALNVEAFGPLDEFRAMADGLSQKLKATERLPECDEILVPGEPERRSHAERSRTGIPVPEKTWEQFLEIAASLGVTWDE
jgi:LDH2 family malate/lactate/ureidoglycolate dehydrogenase